METIKPGMRFKNSFMEVSVLCYTEINNSNLALLLCHNDGLFITVRNLILWQGTYIWDWGHYFSDIHKAIKDYDNRQKDL